MNTENNSPAKNIADGQKKSNTKKSLLASGLSLSFFTLCSRILGLVREMTKASFLGTSKFADAFGIAFMIPNLLRRLFAENSISVAFIPTFRGYLEDSATSGKDSDEFKKTKEFLNSTEEPKAAMPVNCEAVNCVYNELGMCGANSISIAGGPVSSVSKTECNTFVPKF